MRFGVRRSRHIVQAVDDRGLKKLLTALGMLDTLGSTARCARCGEAVMLTTIAAVYPEDGQVRFLCANGKCANAIEEPEDA